MMDKDDELTVQRLCDKSKEAFLLAVELYKRNEAPSEADPRSKGILSIAPTPIREPSFAPSQVGHRRGSEVIIALN